MTLVWTPALAVGHALIDSQHRTLFARYDEFLRACNQGLAPDDLRRLFSFLDDYVREHFAAEEALMEAAGYPEATAHQAAHAAFRDRLAGLRAELGRTGLTPQVLVRTNKALLYWLTDHIREIDTRLAGYLAVQTHGVS